MRVLIFTLLLFVHLYSTDNISASKIYDSILTKIKQQNSVSVYCDSKEYKEILFRSKNIHLVNSAINADIILQTKYESTFQKNSIIFTTKYSILKKNKNIIGAFYWSKGRPQIVFLRKRLDKLKLQIDDDLRKYIVEAL